MHRLQLLEYLDQWRDRPLTLVSAPAGYGKSILISHWVETCNLPNAWLSLDVRDSGLRQFLSYFLAAVQNLLPDAMTETTTLVQAQTMPPLPVLAGSLANEFGDSCFMAKGGDDKTVVIFPLTSITLIRVMSRFLLLSDYILVPIRIE